MTKSLIRLANLNDLVEIERLLIETRGYFKKAKIPQWQGIYPAVEDFVTDIQREECYLALINQKVVGMIVISSQEELNYQAMVSGHWQSQGPYTVIHRLAVSQSARGAGIGRQLMNFAETITLARQRQIIRVDTHELNRGMLALLEASRYQTAGVIKVADGSLRLAFEKNLVKKQHR